MKYLQIITTLFLVISIQYFATAQRSIREYKVALSSGTLVLDDINDLEVVGYSGSELIFMSNYEDDESSDRKRGLKLLNADGLNDNTGIGIAVSKEGSTVIASQITSDCTCEKITVKVPRSVNVSIVSSSHDGNLILVKDFENELEISTNYHDIQLENVTGPMAVKTLYGNIEGTFSKLSQTGSVSIYSVYELVDITLPKNAKANVSLSTPYGDVYTNAAIEVNKTSKVVSTGNGAGGSVNTCSPSPRSSTINGKLNGGGVEFSIKSSYEDIYLRQL